MFSEVCKKPKYTFGELRNCSVSYDDLVQIETDLYRDLSQRHDISDSMKLYAIMGVAKFANKILEVTEQRKADLDEWWAKKQKEEKPETGGGLAVEA